MGGPDPETFDHSVGPQKAAFILGVAVLALDDDHDVSVVDVHVRDWCFDLAISALPRPCRRYHLRHCRPPRLLEPLVPAWDNLFSTYPSSPDT